MSGPDDQTPAAAGETDPAAEAVAAAETVPAGETAPAVESDLAAETVTPDETVTSIDGHTPDELADYLDAGRTPRDASIEGSAECRLYLAALARLRARSWNALTREAAAQPDRDDTWITGLLATITTEVRAGRDIPVGDPDPRVELTLTEAAVVGLIRHTADTLDVLVLGRTVLDGDVSTSGEPITIRLTVAVAYGVDVRAVADTLRARIRTVLAEHTELVVADVVVVIDDVFVPRPSGGER